MGGNGSGAWQSKNRDIEDEYLKLDCVDLIRSGFIKKGQITDGFLQTSHPSLIDGMINYENGILKITGNGESGPINSEIHLTYTYPSFGGDRAWFSCPLCGSRSRILYLVLEQFICRKCAGIKYRSQNLQTHERNRLQANKIKARIEANGGHNFERPKGMHNRTYLELLKAYNDYDSAAMATATGIKYALPGLMKKHPSRK
jgi:hypothetical protein